MVFGMFFDVIFLIGLDRMEIKKKRITFGIKLQPNAVLKCIIKQMSLIKLHLICRGIFWHYAKRLIAY